MFSSSAALFFPVITNIGTLYQVLPDNTSVIFTFSGSPYAPGESSLNMQQSVGGAGPWTTVYQRQFTFTGANYPNLTVALPGPYYANNYFRYRWENVTLGYVGPWSSVLLGPTTKLRWDVTTVPIAPQAIVSATPVNTGFGLPQYIEVGVRHSLVNADDYSNKGIYVTATGLVNGFSITNSAYFVGWGASVGGVENFIVPFGTETYPITSATAASAQYYVLGDPLPGILGTPVNL
jgi:hypothetical protein